MLFARRRRYASCAIAASAAWRVAAGAAREAVTLFCLLLLHV